MPKEPPADPPESDDGDDDAPVSRGSLKAAIREVLSEMGTAGGAGDSQEEPEPEPAKEEPAPRTQADVADRMERIALAAINKAFPGAAKAAQSEPKAEKPIVEPEPRNRATGIRRLGEKFWGGDAK